jgi:hypothetical protein
MLCNMQVAMGRKKSSADAHMQPPQPRCNIDAPNASSESEQLFCWACYCMMAASRTCDVSSARVETYSYERIERGELVEFKRLESCDADDDQVMLQYFHMNNCRPLSEADTPCLQLLQDCGAVPLHPHQLL